MTELRKWSKDNEKFLLDNEECQNMKSNNYYSDPYASSNINNSASLHVKKSSLKKQSIGPLKSNLLLKNRISTHSIKSDEESKVPLSPNKSRKNS